MPPSVVDVPSLDIDPYDEGTLADPTAFHHALRDAGPLVWLPQYGVYAAGRHEEVRSGLSNWEDFTSTAGGGITDIRRSEYYRTPSLLLESDPPDHTRRRVLVDALMSTRAIRSHREHFAAAADELVRALLKRDVIDGVTDIAQPFPLSVFPDTIGFSESVRPHLLPFGELVFNGGGPPNALFQRSLAAAQDATVAIMAQTRREELDPDGLGARIYDAVDAGKLPAEEAPVIIRSFLSAGVDTTVASLSASIYQLASHPEQWELLHQEPSRAKFAFEEAIRLESPVQTFYRVATRDVGFGGATVPTDKKILLSIAAANTDDRMFDDPYAYDITRSTSGHVGFGMGIHQCVGQHFARLEGEAVLTALATHVRAIEIVGQPARHLNNTLRSWGTLPIRLIGA